MRRRGPPCPLKVNAAPARPSRPVPSPPTLATGKSTQGGESFHQGLDIAAYACSPIAALFFGVVTETGEKRQLWSLYQKSVMAAAWRFCMPTAPRSWRPGRRAAGWGDGGPGGKHRGFYWQSPAHRGALERSRLRSGRCCASGMVCLSSAPLTGIEFRLSPLFPAVLVIILTLDRSGVAAWCGGFGPS